MEQSAGTLLLIQDCGYDESLPQHSELTSKRKSCRITLQAISEVSNCIFSPTAEKKINDNNNFSRYHIIALNINILFLDR